MFTGILVGLLLASNGSGSGASEGWAVAGCYKVVVGTLKMPRGEAITEAAAASLPPSRIRLTLEAPTATEREAHYVPEGLAVRPDHVRAELPVFELGAWTTDEPGNIHIVWNGGFSRVGIEAKRRDFEWVGKLSLESDERGRPVPSARVTLTPLSCE